MKEKRSEGKDMKKNIIARRGKNEKGTDMTTILVAVAYTVAFSAVSYAGIVLAWAYSY